LLNANEIHRRALHDADRLRDALDTILTIAQDPLQTDVLRQIARVARNALIHAAPPDPDFVPGDEWGRR